VKLSYSKISTYQTCPLKYKLVYIDRAPVKRGPSLILGGAVHDALAYLHDPGALAIPALDEVVDRFCQEFAKASQEGDLGGKDPDALHREGVRILSGYYEKGAAIARKKRTLGVELHFQFPLDGHYVEGYIDRLDVGESGNMEVFDYKTGRAKTQLYAADDLQMACYTMGVTQMYPGRQVTCTLLYVSVANGFPLSKAWQEPELEEKRWVIRDVAAGIEGERFEPVVDRHCDWCDVRPACPMWTAPPAPGEIADVAAEYAALDDEIGKKEERLKELRELLIKYAIEHGERFPAGRFWVHCKQSQAREYDPEALRAILSPLGLWDNVTKLEKKRVDELLETDTLAEEQKRQVKGLLRPKSTSWRISVKPREEEGSEGPEG